MGAPNEGVFLVIEDDDEVLHSLCRMLEPHVRTAGMRTLSEALAFLNDDHVVDGAIIDIGLPDGSGLEVLDHLRRHSPRTLALVLTGANDEDVIRRVQLLGAEYLPKPSVGPNLLAFVNRARNRAARTPRAAPAFSPLEAYLTDKGLTHRQRQALIVDLRSDTRAEAARELGISEATLKTIIRTVLHKCGAKNLRKLSADILEAAGQS